MRNACSHLYTMNNALFSQQTEVYYGKKIKKNKKNTQRHTGTQTVEGLC